MQKSKTVFIDKKYNNKFFIIFKWRKPASSLNLGYYKEEISEYLQKYNLKYILSPPIFCYCINLQLSDEDFKDSFLFLQNYFDRNLKIKNGK